MPSILVVEHEGRYIERIRQALVSEGWRPRFVAGRPEALRAAASEAPNVVLVNAELPGAPELLRAFARRFGGPGAVALVGERGQGEDVEADERLAKPFSDQDLRLAVRRRLAAAGEAAPAPAPASSPSAGDDRKWTSQEIFGDLLVEVEGEVAAAGATVRAPQPASSFVGAGQAAARPAEPRRAAGPAAGAASARDLDDDLERRLERTLSGVPGLASRRGSAAGRPAADQPRPGDASPPLPDEPPREEPPPGPPADEPPRREPPARELPPEPPRRDPPPARPPQGDPPPARREPRTLRAADDDVDELLNMTLTGLDLGVRTVRRAAPEARPAAPPPAARAARTRAADIDLTEIEALAGLGRRRAPRPDEGAPVPSTTEPLGEGAGAAPLEEAAAADLRPAPARSEALEPADPSLRDRSPAAAERATETAPPAAPPLAAEPPSAPPESGVPDPAPEPPAVASEPGAPAAIDAAPTEDAEGAGVAPGAAAADAEPSVPVPAAASFPTHPAGRRFGHYTLLDRIAVGGMAEVWKARMSGVEGFQKTVAIKRILPHMNDDADFVDMFIDEAKLAAQLNHPNITHIYDLGKIGDDYYIAMEYVDGRNLRSILNESRRKALPLPVGFALVVASRLASALEYAHRKRDFDGRDLELVHRDVSPQNVLISTDGDIKLCDFGISKAVAKVSQTETGALKGKLQYMSPEQAWGRPVDPRADIFSLGALTFEMLTGERLFTGDSEISVLEAVRECRVRGPRQVNPAVPENVDVVVLRALAREPGERFPTAGALQQALEDVLYRLRPTPGQSDVAAFLARLAEAPEAKPGGHLESSTGGRASAAAFVAPGTASGKHGERDGSAAGGATAGGTGTGRPLATGGSGSRAGAAQSPAATADERSWSGAGRPGPGSAAPDARAGDAERERAEAGSASWPGEEPGGPVPEAPPATAATTGARGAGAARDSAAPVADEAGEAARGGRWWWPFGSGRGERAGAAPPMAIDEEGEAGGGETVTAADAASIDAPGPAPTSPSAADRGTVHGAATTRAAAAAHGAAAAAFGLGSGTGGGARTTGGGNPATGMAAPGPWSSAGPSAVATAGGAIAAEGPAAVRPAIAARGRVPAVEDGSRGRWWLVAAILLLAAASLATWLWLELPGSALEEPPPAAAPAPTPREAALPPADAAPARPPADGEAAAVPDLERLVDEKLAETEEALRAQAEAEYEEKERRILQQIEALREKERAAAPPATEPAPPPGDEDPSPEPPPAASLVTSHEAQYPADARGPRSSAASVAAGTSHRG